MDSTIVDMFAQGVDAFITSIIVSFMVIMLSQQQTMANVVSENHATALEMQEYREYNAYDHKHVYAADIISLILRKQSYPEIEVRTANGTTLKFNLTSHSVDYDVDKLYLAIDPRYLYDSDVSYDDSQYRTGVNKITFRACSNSSCTY